MNELILPTFTNAASAYDLLDVSEATKRDYSYRLPVFITFLQENGFDNSSYIRYKQWVAKQHWSVATKNKHMVAARVFLKEMHRQGQLPIDITVNVRLFKQSKEHKRRALSSRDVKRLTTWLSELPDCAETDRVKAIISLLMLQGMRTIEICRLDVADLDLDNEVAWVHGKSRDDKEPVLLLPLTVENLKRYIRTNGISEGALFKSNSFKTYGQPLSTRGLREIVTDILRRLEIHKNVHSFRHYYTTELLTFMSGELLDVAQFTRHRSLEMLRVYDNRRKHEANSNRVAAIFAGVNF